MDSGWDRDEVARGTNPLQWDTDGTDPLDPTDDLLPCHPDSETGSALARVCDPSVAQICIAVVAADRARPAFKRCRAFADSTSVRREALGPFIGTD